MEVIDQIKVNFSPDQLILLNICLGFLMFGVALDIKVSDFRELLLRPKPAIVGMISQLVLLPLATLLLVYFMSLPASLSLGMILVAACPGGNVSNYAVHVAKANTALSVMMTSFSTLLAIVVTPLYFTLFAPMVPDSELVRASIAVDPLNIIKTIIQLIAIPLALGMYLNHKYDELTIKLKKFVKPTSMIIFLGIVVFAIVGNFDNIINYIHIVFYIVLIHNALALFIGYQWSRAMGLSISDRRTVSIETGIQNSGLALILIFNFFGGLGGMALIAAWWGTWHLVAGFGLASFWARKEVL